MFGGKGVAPCIVAAFVLAVSTGCSAVNSYQVDSGYQPDGTQRAGSYYLPKHLLKVSVTGTKENSSFSLETIPVQDRALLLDTGLALSPLSHDDIKVEFSDGLLTKVTSVLRDETASVVEEVAKLAVKLRDGAAAQDPALNLSFDPFDYNEAVRANHDLRQFDICVEVEVAPGLWSPGCGSWSRGQAYTSGVTLATSLRGKVAPGIYYRQPESLMVHVVKKGKTVRLASMPFANGSPIFRLDIRRSIFVERTTTIDFVNGSLKSVDVNKPSEALAVAQFPAKIVEVFANAVTGGTAKARSTVLEAQAEEILGKANVDNAIAARVATGDPVVNFTDTRSNSLGGQRAGYITEEELLRQCARADDDFTRNQCIQYWGM